MQSDLGLVTDGTTSVVAPQSGRPPGELETWNDGATYRAVSYRDRYTPGGVASPKSTVRNVFQGSRTVNGDFFNVHLYDPGANGIPTDIDYYGVRLHDTRGPVTGEGLRWHNIDKVGGYDWRNLDAVVDALATRSKDILYMAICTPDRYASANPGNGKYDGGSGVFTGSNQYPSAGGKTAWAAFATALAQRYNGGAHGRIGTYEVWNEVNYGSYWAGTQAQYAELLRLFRNAVRAVDNTLKVGAPTIQEPEGSGNAWLTTFLAASDGAAGVGADNMDYCFVHLYPPVYNFAIAGCPQRNLSAQIPLVQTALTNAGKGSLEIWNTETGVLFDPARVIDETWKARMVKRSLALCAAMGVKRYYWYTYDNPDISMSSLMKDAWQEMRGVLIGNAIQNCNVLPDERVCITINGRDFTY